MELVDRLHATVAEKDGLIEVGISEDSEEEFKELLEILPQYGLEVHSTKPPEYIYITVQA